MKKQLPSFRKRKQKTVERSLQRYHWSKGQLDVKEARKAPEQYPTSPRERTEHEQTRARDFGWINGQF